MHIEKNIFEWDSHFRSVVSNLQTLRLIFMIVKSLIATWFAFEPDGITMTAAKARSFG